MTFLALFVLAAWMPVGRAQNVDSVVAVADYGYDADGDGIFESLAVDVQVEVAVPGDHIVSGWLDTPDWSLYVADCGSQTRYVETTATLTLYCRGTDINRVGVDGPYLFNVALYGPGWNLLVYTVSLTQAYLASSFEAPPVFVVQPILAYGVDTNGNGLFDVLRVDFSLDVRTEGLYGVNVFLYDPSYTYTDYGWSQALFSVGTVPQSFDFSGWKISGLAIPGPYLIQVTIQDDQSALVAQASATTPDGFDPSQFDQPPAAFLPPYVVSLTDSDGDGLANFLSVDVTIRVNEGGDFYLWAQVFDPNTYTFFSGDSAEYILGPGLTAVHFDLSTIPLAASRLDGPYGIQLQVDMFVDTWNSVTIGTDTFYTPAYTADQFDAPPAHLGTAVSGAPVDRDSDGVGDVYRVGFEVDVQEAGLYWFSASLQSSYGWVPSAVGYRALEPGLQTVTLDFPGTAIRQTGVSGLVDLNVEMGVQVGRTLAFYDSGVYGVGPLDPGAFDAPIAASLSGTVVDASSGAPLTDIRVTAYNYETEQKMSTGTDGLGHYSFNLYEGDWVLTLFDYDQAYARTLAHESVTAPSSQADLAMSPFVPSLRVTRLQLSSWDSVDWTRSWTFKSDGTTRLEDDWDYGNRDGYLDQTEFDATRAWPGSQPTPIPSASGETFQVDGMSYGLVPGSGSFAYSNVEGSIDDTTPITAMQEASFANSAPVAASEPHTLSVNVEWSLPWYDRRYEIGLPSGFVVTAVDAPPGIEAFGLGTGTVVLVPGMDPDATDGITSAWVTITAAPVVPTIADVLAEPNPGVRGEPVTLSAKVTVAQGPAVVSVQIFDPHGRSLGTFPMAYNPSADRYEYTAAFKARGTYTFVIVATDTLGQSVSATGTFSLGRVPRTSAPLDTTQLI